MKKIEDRFLNYISFDTKSDPEKGEIQKPSTEGQLVLARQLKQDRFERLMMEQMGISEELLNSKVGKVLEVLIEEKADDKTYIGRSEYDAPEIDTEVIFTSDRELEIGSFVKVCIEDSQEYELLGVYNEHSK